MKIKTTRLFLLMVLILTLSGCKDGFDDCPDTSNWVTKREVLVHKCKACFKDEK